MKKLLAVFVLALLPLCSSAATVPTPVATPQGWANWATGPSAVYSVPSSGKQAQGWVSAEKPPFQWWNWLCRTTAQALAWLKNQAERSDARLTNLETYAGNGQRLFQCYSNANWTVPAGVYSATFYIIGAGGGGGSGTVDPLVDACGYWICTGAGGGGGDVRVHHQVVSEGQVYYCWAGYGGYGGKTGPNPGANGTNGGSSYVQLGPDVINSAIGGYGGEGVGPGTCTSGWSPSCTPTTTPVIPRGGMYGLTQTGAAGTASFWYWSIPGTKGGNGSRVAYDNGAGGNANGPTYSFGRGGLSMSAWPSDSRHGESGETSGGGGAGGGSMALSGGDISGGDGARGAVLIYY